MGGPINVAIRFSDGEIVRRAGWTNGTPFWFTHPEMKTDPDSHLRKYVDPERWVILLEDSGSIECPLAPDGYGLVFIDVPTRRLLNMQGYTSYGQIYVIGALNEIPMDYVYENPGDKIPTHTRRSIPKAWVTDGPPEETATDLWCVWKFQKDGLITGVQCWDHKLEKFGSISLEEFCRPERDEIGKAQDAPITSEDLMVTLFALLKSQGQPDRRRSANIMVDTGFETVRFEENVTGSLSFRATLVGMEIPIAEAEWNEWDARKAKDEAEEDEEEE